MNITVKSDVEFKVKSTSAATSIQFQFLLIIAQAYVTFYRVMKYKGMNGLSYNV